MLSALSRPAGLLMDSVQGGLRTIAAGSPDNQQWPDCIHIPIPRRAFIKIAIRRTRLTPQTAHHFSRQSVRAAKLENWKGIERKKWRAEMESRNRRRRTEKNRKGIEEELKKIRKTVPDQQRTFTFDCAACVKCDGQIVYLERENLLRRFAYFGECSQ